MKSLWFKGRFVEAILRGEKRSTVRRRSTRLPKRGDVVALSVGPSRPFATARIVARSPVTEISEGVRRIYGLSVGRHELTQLEFELIDTKPSSSPRA